MVGIRNLVIVMAVCGVFMQSSPQAADVSKELVVNVKKMGAKGDGKSNDGRIIQEAINKCAAAGGGTVLLPTGGVYLSDPLYLKSKTTLNIEEGATLLANNTEGAFWGSLAGRPVLSFIMVELNKPARDVTITGKGTIDGNGEIWWKRFTDSGNKYERPRLIYIVQCTNLKIENVTLKNSPSFHFVPLMCDSVTVNNVKINAPESSPNTDGIDPSRSKNVKISNCTIDVGDDDIALKADKLSDGKTLVPCENIEVSNCTILNGHGISIGSETNSGVKNFSVKNCTFRGTENGIRIKSSEGKGGVMENLTYSDINMQDVLVPITISWTYGDKNKKDDPVQKAPQWMPVLKSFSIKNLKATGGKNSGTLYGLPESMLENVSLENVEITGAERGMTIKYANGVSLKNVKVVPKSGVVFTIENIGEKGLKIE